MRAGPTVEITPIFDPYWTRMMTSRTTKLAAPTSIVVTGATGFLGGVLLQRLLADQRIESIICPVRADSSQHAVERGHTRMATLLGQDIARAEAPRVRWIKADLEERRLGWDSATWRDVATTTAEVFHCAASVSFDLPLAEATRINVDGTKHIHELATTAQTIHGQVRRFHHVSTAYVSGVADGKVDADHLPADRAANFRNTYERTKANAERFLRTAATGAQPDTVPVSIYRPSIVAGDTATGVTDNWNVLYVPMKMAARGLLPMFPMGGRALIDSVGVDFVVDGMLALRQHATEPLHAFHLTAGRSAFTLDELFETTWVKADGYAGFTPSRTRLLSTSEWNTLAAGMRMAAMAPKKLGRLRRIGTQAQRGLKSCAVYIPYSRVDTIFDASKEHRLLRTHGVTMPAGDEYLETIVDYALAVDFGKRVRAKKSTDAAEPRVEVAA